MQRLSTPRLGSERLETKIFSMFFLYDYVFFAHHVTLMCPLLVFDLFTVPL